MSNLQLLTTVCREIEPILDQVVLVGGCATELLITDQAAPEVRYTVDVDMLIEVVSLAEYYKSGKVLKKLGFKENKDVICRWQKEDLVLDLMPTDKKILGFANLWYKDTIQNKIAIKLEDMNLYHISAPYFIATKLEAFLSRGKDDFWASHDLEDIISIIDGRSELINEICVSDPSLRMFIQNQFNKMINNNQFIEALPGYLPPDTASQERIGLLKKRIDTLATLN